MNLDEEIAKLERMKQLLIDLIELKEKCKGYDAPHVCPPCPYPHYYPPYPYWQGTYVGTTAQPNTTTYIHYGP